MPDRSKSLRESAPEQPAGFAAPRLEQLLFACGGYVVAQLAVLAVVSDPADEDFLLLGISGAFIGVVAHVLIRGIGVKVPGFGKRFRMRVSKQVGSAPGKKKDSSALSQRVSRYRAALSALRRPLKRRKRQSEAPGNEEKIVKTAEGYRVGDRIFSRRAEAEDYLYVGDPPAGDGAKHRKTAPPAAQQSRRFSWRQARLLNTAALAFAVVLAGLLFFFL